MAGTIEREQVRDLSKELFGESAEVPAAPRLRPPTGRKWLIAGGVLVLGAVIAAAAVAGRPSTPRYGTATAARMNLSRTVTATGHLQAVTTVQVGTQVSGTISEIYADFNSRVKKGQVIARLDPSQLQAQLTQATANLASAQANAANVQAGVTSADAAVESAAANVVRAQSVIDAAQQVFNRTQQLVEAKVSARSELETAQAALDQAIAQKQQGTAQVNQARAQAQSARSQLAQARAQVAQAKAAVDFAAVNVQHTIITAPIDGTIVSRNVDVGQTVAASLQAPILFLIANDLTRMQVLADIDEADVGPLQPQSLVEFAVDAYPTQTFHGLVSQIRLAPQTVQNVVTYTAVIDVANPDLKLKPGMTANVSAKVGEQADVLAVPNSALRFRPEGAAPRTARPGAGTVYRVAGETLEPVPVKTGVTDGVSTQIVSGNLREGDQLAVPLQTANRAPAASSRGMFGGLGGRPAGRVR